MLPSPLARSLVSLTQRSLPAATVPLLSVCVTPFTASFASSPSTSAVTAAARPRPRQWEMPSGAWKLSPHDSDRVLFEDDVKDCYRNIVHLTEGGRMITNGPLHRLLTKVNSEEDVEVAKRALWFCRLRFVPFTRITAGYFTHGCLRAGVPETALEILEDYLKYRMWASRNSYHALLLAFGNEQNASCVMRTWRALCDRDDVQINAQSLYLAVRGLIRSDDYEGTLKVMQYAADNDIPVKSSTSSELLNGVCSASDEVSVNVLGKLMATVHEGADPEALAAAKAHVNSMRSAEEDSVEDEGEAAAAAAAEEEAATA